MYTSKTKQLINDYSSWLKNIQWEYFSTITFKYDMTNNQSRNHMELIIKKIKLVIKKFYIFYVIEPTSDRRQTHIHLLSIGKGVTAIINQYLKKKKISNPKFVKHEEFNKYEGATSYLVKYINSNSVDYDVDCSNNYKKKL